MRRSPIGFLGVLALGVVLWGCSEQGSSPLGVPESGSYRNLSLASHVTTTIDFEEFNGGDVVTTTQGVNVSVTNQGRTCTTNALAFDSSNPPGVGGDDKDLGTPHQDFGGPGLGAGGAAGSPFQNDTSLGILLIIQENPALADNNPSPQDDCAKGGTLVFDFSGVNASGVILERITVIDIDANETPTSIKLYGPGNVLLATFSAGPTGNNGVVTVNLGSTPGVVQMRVKHASSAGVDNIVYSEEEENGEVGLQGCTPGYWKNLRKHGDEWTAPFDPTDPLFDATANADTNPNDGLFGGFTDADLNNNGINDTLIEALNFGGGPGVEGAERILSRAAVAAILNAAHPDVAYPLTVAQIIQQVETALATRNRGTILAKATELDDFNNLGCTLN